MSGPANTTEARPEAGTLMLWLPAGLSLINKVTVRVAAGVPNPATVATIRVLVGSQTCAGAATLSTVQFGVTAAPTGCSTRVTPGGRRSSLKSGGRPVAC